LLFLGEKLGSAGGVGQEEEGNHGDQHRDGAFDEEYPRPSLVPAKFDLSQSRGQQTAKRAYSSSASSRRF
jgi:hypothetical protein